MGVRYCFTEIISFDLYKDDFGYLFCRFGIYVNNYYQQYFPVIFSVTAEMHVCNSDTFIKIIWGVNLVFNCMNKKRKEKIDIQQTRQLCKHQRKKQQKSNNKKNKLSISREI